MTAQSEHDHVSLIGKPVGIWTQRPVVDERHETSRRYPQALMPSVGVRVTGFTVALDIELARNPEAATLGRRVFEQVRDAIEYRIAHFDLAGHAVDEQESHGVAASRDGAGSVSGSPVSDSPGIGEPDRQDGAA